MARTGRIQASQVFDTQEVAPARYVVRVAVGPHADLVDIVVCFARWLHITQHLAKRSPMRMSLIGQVAMLGLR